MGKQNNDFFQPIISVFGLAISTLSTLLPLFNQNFATELFLNNKLVKPFSFIAFIMGIAIVWIIWNFHPYPYISLWKQEKQGQVFFKINLQPYHVLWILVFMVIIFATAFLYIGIAFADVQKVDIALAVLQGLFYLLFFLALIAIFSFLFIQSKNRVENEENNNNLPFIVFETLDKNRLIKPGIEVYENVVLGFQEAQNFSLPVGMYRKFRVVTQPQKEEVLEFITSLNGKEIVKILKKQDKNRTLAGESEV